MFRFLNVKYGFFNKTWEGEILVRGWITVWNINYMRSGRGKSTKLELDLIDLQYTLPMFQMAYWWELYEDLAPIFWRCKEGYWYQSQYRVRPWIRRLHLDR